MLDKIKCIAHYDVADEDKRNCFLAACTKLDYIFSCLYRMDISLDVLSACGARGSAAIDGEIKHLNESTSLELLPHHGRGNKLKNIYSELTFRRRLKKRAYEFVEDGDVLIVYHSLALIDLIKDLKKKKDFRLILEVEEIYGDVSEDKRISEKEYDFFKCADAFIFPTQSLNAKINRSGKPYVISHGTYKAEADMGGKLFDDDRIHCIYAGTLDPRKGGGPMAIRSAQYLPENYQMHILGFGNDKDVAGAKELIATVSQKSACKLTYDGVLSGAEYLRFLQSCHIGLSTQNPQAIFNDTSFPSKILSYFSNGVQVVSVRIPVVETSKVGQYIHYYDSQAPEEIAKAILSIDIDRTIDTRQIIRSLDSEFYQSFRSMLMSMT